MLVPPRKADCALVFLYENSTAPVDEETTPKKGPADAITTPGVADRDARIGKGAQSTQCGMPEEGSTERTLPLQLFPETVVAPPAT